MKREMLDEWAAKFMGEEGDEIASAVSAQWYTGSPAAAFAVMHKMAKRNNKVEIEIDGDRAEVYCGNAEEEGDSADLGELMIRACYRCHNG